MKQENGKAADDILTRLFENGYDDDYLMFRGEFDGAIIGMTHDDRVVYDYDLMVQCTMESQHCDYDEAVGWVEHNALGALPYMGGDSPVIINRLRGIDLTDHEKSVINLHDSVD